VSVSEGRPVSGDRVAKGALYGAVGGAVLGGALISFMFHTETSDKHPKGRALDIGVAAAFGLVAGAIGGAMHAPERWRAVSPR